MGPKEDIQSRWERLLEEAQTVRAEISVLKEFVSENRYLVKKSREELIIARAIMQFADEVLSIHKFKL